MAKREICRETLGMPRVGPVEWRQVRRLFPQRPQPGRNHPCNPNLSASGHLDGKRTRRQATLRLRVPWHVSMNLHPMFAHTPTLHTDTLPSPRNNGKRTRRQATLRPLRVRRVTSA